MRLKLFNTLSGKKEVFTPINENDIGMYVCGPTVYDRPHLGNARSAVVFDVLYRVLKHMYPKVTYVRNITDVDDKIYQAASCENISIQEFAEKNIKLYREDIAKLNVLEVDIEPKATEHIQDIIRFIEKLIENGNAYVSDNHAYFDVSSFKGYGKLSKKNITELKEGVRIEVCESKRNPLDFVLWKPVDERFNFGWESPWGKGRPGWHIECSAMSSKYLGETFDIHGGGIDLVFPHHENEIAQSCAISKNETMANYWVHNGHLNVDGTKMSKSLGNFFTVNELLEKFDGETLRMAFLATHYASPMDFSTEALNQAGNVLNRWQNAIKDIEIEETEEIFEEVLNALLDDLNTPKALSTLSEIVDKINKGNVKLASIFINTCQKLLGILVKNPKDWFCNVSSEKKKWIEEKIKQRQIAKSAKNYSLADEIRHELLNDGIIIEDAKDGVNWKKTSLKEEK